MRLAGKKKFERFVKNERDRRILLAALSAFGAKFGGVALQLFSIPLVIRTLGVQDFSIFAIASSIIAFVMFSNLGISGYIVTAISAARIQVDGCQDIAGIMVTALCVTVVSGTLLLLGTYIYSISYGLENIFGGLFLYAPKTVTQVFYLILIFGVLQSISIVFIAAQNAYQELYFSNIYGGCANLISALSIAAYYFIAEEAQVLGYLLALYLPMVLCQLINATHFLIRHPEARPRLKLISRSLVAAALCSGGAFFVAQTALPISIREFPKLILATRGELAQVTTYALLMTLWTMLSGIIAAFTQPLFGGIADAWSNGEVAWVSKRIMISIGAYILIGVGLMLTGHFYGFKLTSIWVGVDAAISNRTMVIFGLFLGLAGIFYILTIASYAMNMKFQSMIINVVSSLCILLGVWVMEKTIVTPHILGIISGVLSCAGISLSVLMMQHYSRKSMHIQQRPKHLNLFTS